MSNGDLTMWSRGGWSDKLPVGRDVNGSGFPEYNGGGFVRETQSVGPADDGMTDFQRGVEALKKDPIGGAGKVLGSIFGDPLGTLGKGAGSVLGSAGASLSPLVMKGVFFGLGAIFLAAGLWAIFKTAPQEAAST